MLQLTISSHLYSISKIRKEQEPSGLSSAAMDALTWTRKNKKQKNFTLSTVQNFKNEKTNKMLLISFHSNKCGMECFVFVAEEASTIPRLSKMSNFLQKFEKYSRLSNQKPSVK